jgi:hypothetical protein
MSLFVNLIERNIAAELINNFLSVKDLSILQCSCKSVRKTILNWKENFECLEELKMSEYHNDFDSITKLSILNSLRNCSNKVQEN